ncbi:MAG: transposase [Chloroflexi bacterium]|nr:transposase [Chloroflexota bacterium]
MVPEASVLVGLIVLIDRIPPPPPPERRGRGRPPVYPDRLFLKALVIMLVKRLTTVHALLAVLEQPTPEMQRLRMLLLEDGRYPARRTWQRRLRAIPATLPAQIGCLGRSLVVLLDPWRDCGRAAAIDSTVLRARGGVWHRKDREAGSVPHSSIDTEAHWTKSGWHGWVYGWKLHLVTTVAAVWIPLAATLTPANRADNEEAPELLRELPAELRVLLGDTGYNDPDLRDGCAADERELVTTRRGPYPHQDGGVEVRRLFHHLRSHAIENFNGQFKGIFDCLGQVPTRGLLATQRFALGAVFVYQLSLLYRFETGGELRVGLKAFLNAA